MEVLKYYIEIESEHFILLSKQLRKIIIDSSVKVYFLNKMDLFIHILDLGEMPKSYLEV